VLQLLNNFFSFYSNTLILDYFQYSNKYVDIICIFRDDYFKNESENSRGSFIGCKPNIEELEMLLEAYFVQIDGTLNKLSTVSSFFSTDMKHLN